MSLAKNSSLSSHEQPVKVVGVSVGGGHGIDLEVDHIFLDGLSLRHAILLDALQLGFLLQES